MRKRGIYLKKRICTIILLYICMHLFACQKETLVEEAEELMNTGQGGISFNQTEELFFKVTDNRNLGETVYYKSASDFIADCGFEEDELFWEYDMEKEMEKDSVQLVLYYDENSGEGCGVRYYPDEENKQEEGFRFSMGDGREPQYSVMEAWVDLASSSTLSCKRNTGKTFVSEYEESEEYFPGYTYSTSHFKSKGIMEKGGMPVSLIEIDWTYRIDKTLQKKEYKHNPQVFGTYRSSAEYYYNWGEKEESEKLLYQKFRTDSGNGEVYYIYGEDEIFPEFYFYIDRNAGNIDTQMVSYNTEIPDEDKMNLDEEMILAQYPCEPPFYANIDHYDDEGNPVVHLYKVVGRNEDELHTHTSDWITVNSETGIGLTFWNRIVDIIHEEEKIQYYCFLSGQTEAVGTDSSQETLAYYYEWGSGFLPYTYVDLNDDGVEELILYPKGISMQILTIDHDEVYWVDTPFYSGATGEIINTNKEIVMIDDAHAGRNQYSVYRLNDEKELEDVIFFQVWFGGESGLEKDEYSQYVGGMDKGTEEIITKDEFDELYEKYVSNVLDVEWMEYVQ